ncbi:undecaprenyl-diphosphatase UppP [Synechococcus sp. PCC 7502]|uniref:undecaprenyl-diphosphate phosphatase n=1 Tax=Synechococcus sp. PCC 7502 TaxID=1173263 RepID=UPI00029FD682|nr:undecaprenyl-diphosphate phosphatase [Synechococcus sp. PCC 7502]AFY74709.1 undecaprenyl-diphosphatase UppP [Synechococcus sp. PCC 7502]
MEYFQAFVLGIIQGITEFLPISSTAHLIVFTHFLGWENLGQKAFVDAIQLGSVFAVVWYFWADLRNIFGGATEAFQNKDWQREEWKLLVGVGVGTIPALAVGYIFKDVLPKSILVIAIASIVMAILLGLAEEFGSRKRGFETLEIKDGILVGIGQTLALIPGVSRSGSTLTTGLFLGLERSTAARFSFLLGLPTLTIATLYESIKVIKNVDSFAILAVGIISAFIFSYLAIAFLIEFLKTKSTWIFIWYRLAFGGILLVISILGK